MTHLAVCARRFTEYQGCGQRATQAYYDRGRQDGAAASLGCRRVRTARSQSSLVAASRRYFQDHAEDIDKAQVAIKAFAIDYGARYPKAVTKITQDTSNTEPKIAGSEVA